MTRNEFTARFPRWEYLSFDYGRWTTTHENYDASWEGEEDGYVSNGLMCEGRSLEELAEEVEAKEAEMHAASAMSAGTAATAKQGAGLQPASAVPLAADAHTQSPQGGTK